MVTALAVEYSTCGSVAEADALNSLPRSSKLLPMADCSLVESILSVPSAWKLMPASASVLKAPVLAEDAVMALRICDRIVRGAESPLRMLPDFATGSYAMNPLMVVAASL